MSAQKLKKVAGLPSEAIIEYDGGDVSEYTDDAKDTLRNKGFVVVTGLPQEPVVREGDTSVSRAFYELASAIGRPMVYPEEGMNGAVTDIRPSQNISVGEISYKTSNEFKLHTDLSYFRKPPQYMGLFVVRPDRRKEAMSELAHVDDAVSGLNRRVVDVLCQSKYEFPFPQRAGDSASEKFRKAVRGPILERGEDGFRVRVRRDTIALDNAAIGALDELYKQLQRVKKSFFPEAGTAILVDNTKVLHARTAFTPTHGLEDRHIQRVYLEP